MFSKKERFLWPIFRILWPVFKERILNKCRKKKNDCKEVQHLNIKVLFFYELKKIDQRKITGKFFLYLRIAKTVLNVVDARFNGCKMSLKNYHSIWFIVESGSIYTGYLNIPLFSRCNASIFLFKKYIYSLNKQNFALLTVRFSKRKYWY